MNKVKRIFIIFISLLLFCSCQNNNESRLNLANSFTYIEAPMFLTASQVSQLTGFKTVSLNNRKNITQLLENKDNCIWFRIDFTIPNELKNKDLGLFIEELKTADRVYINNIPCGSYGKFPPDELSAGFGAQHFTLGRSTLKQLNPNTILIQAWTGCPFSLPENIFLSTEFDAYKTAERNAFFTSRIILCFACISFIAFFIYLLLHFFLRKFSNSNTYLYYSFLMLFSVITLLPFCLYEIPWLKPQYLSYFTIMKILISFGIFTTIYFVNKFMISFVGSKECLIIRIARIVFYIIPLTAMLTIKTYEQIPLYITYFFPIIFIQFIFSAYKIIKALISKKTRKKSILLLIFLIPAIIGFVIDLTSHKYANIEITPPYASIYLWQITTYIFISYLLKNFASMYIKNTKLKNDMVMFNAKLENEVEIRTKELSEKNFILSRGLEAITLVQQEVLPKKNKTFMGWDIASIYLPFDSDVSGDIYDYYFTNSKLDGLSIIDISGHGITAGLMSILAKGIINQQYLSGIANSKSLSEILVTINDIYIKEKGNVENYFTGLLFDFKDFDENDICTVNVANAGHPGPILYSSSTNTITEIKYNNPEKQYGFIGVEGLPISFPTTSFSMAQNDILVCFTDGLTEAMNNNKEEFSKIRVEEVLKQYNNLPASEILIKLTESLYNFIGNCKLSDDLTVIVMKRNNSSEYLEEI